MTACPECAGRSYLCLEHNEAARAHEDGTTLTLFAARWEARLGRERAAALVLGRDAFFAGRAVARGERTLEDAMRRLRLSAARLDSVITLTNVALIGPALAQRVIADNFRAGYQVRKAS